MEVYHIDQKIPQNVPLGYAGRGTCQLFSANCCKMVEWGCPKQGGMGIGQDHSSCHSLNVRHLCQASQSALHCSNQTHKVALIPWRHPDRTAATFSKGKIIECSGMEIVLYFTLLTEDLQAHKLCLFSQSWKGNQNHMNHPSNPWAQWTGWPQLLSQYVWLGVLNPSNYWHGALVLWQLFPTFFLTLLFCFLLE